MTESTLSGQPGVRSALERCVAMPAAQFAEEIWGKRWLLTRADELSVRFDDLFGADAVDELLSRRGVRTPFIRMVKQGMELAAADFTRSGGVGARAGDQVSDDKVLAAMADGASIMFEGLHRFWPPLVDFVARFSAEIGHPARANAHITPPHARGVGAHHDVHDVFVLQISGRKHWRVHAPVYESPLHRHSAIDPLIAARAKEDPILDTVLQPGDTLYLPRGTVHAASTEDETSIHISIGVPPLTCYDLVSHLVETVKSEPELRASLPMGIDLTDPVVLAEYLDSTLKMLREKLGDTAPEDAARYMTDALMDRARPEPVAPLAQLSLARSLGPSTKLRRRLGLQLHRDELEDQQIRVTKHDRFVSFPAFVSGALDVALSGTAFTPADLRGLNADDQIAFTRRLVHEGFVVPVEAD